MDIPNATRIRRAYRFANGVVGSCTRGQRCRLARTQVSAGQARIEADRVVHQDRFLDTRRQGPLAGRQTA
jgi:hypothetical protein